MRKGIAVLLACVLLLCSGCVDVESYLQPPRSQGQQQAVQQALETALAQGDGDGKYILKYPSGGDISSAFLMLDATGTPTAADDAVMAVAFYAAAAGERTHICLLRRENDGWLATANVEGQATDLHKVSLADLDGDGTKEVLVGWDLYSNSYQLSVYCLDDTLTATPDAGRYTAYFAGDMNADGKEEFMLLHIGSTVTASLCSWQAARATVMGTAALPAGVRGFEKMLLGKLTNGEDGLYLDTLLDSGSYTTVLLYWDGARLRTPLHSGDVARIADRSPYIAVMDVDGNGVPEIPVTTRLLDSEAGVSGRGQFLTEWYGWDIGTDTTVRQCGSIANTVDGYCIELEEEWIATLGGRYDEETRTLWLEQTGENGEKVPFLIIQNTSDGETAVEGYTFEALPGNLPLRIWYETAAPYRLTMEKISYMLVAL